MDDLEAANLVTFGQEAVSSFSAKLDAILVQLTNAQSPVLFELFRTIRDGVNGANLSELEVEIRSKLNGNILDRILIAIGLKDPAERLKRVGEEVRSLLQSKAKSLSDLIRPKPRSMRRA